MCLKGVRRDFTGTTHNRCVNIRRAWVGFNASHSLGAILFSAVYIPLAFSHIQYIANNNWFAVLPSIVGISYLLLAKNYWFKIPFFGIVLSTLCFLVLLC